MQQIADGGYAGVAKFYKERLPQMLIELIDKLHEENPTVYLTDHIYIKDHFSNTSQAGGHSLQSITNRFLHASPSPINI
jgi:hypothetical protein